MRKCFDQVPTDRLEDSSGSVLTCATLTCSMWHMSKRTLGQVVRDRREAAGVSRERLANDAGVSVSTLARLELRDQAPGLTALDRIAAGLQTTTSDLLAARQSADVGAA